MSDRDKRAENPANGQASTQTLAELIAASPRPEPAKMRPYIQSASWTPAGPDSTPAGRPAPPKMRAIEGQAHRPKQPATAVAVVPQQVVALRPKLGSASQVFLGTIAPTEAELERVVMEFRARLYAQWQHLPATRYPAWLRGGDIATADRKLDYLRWSEGVDPCGLPEEVLPRVRGATQEEKLQEWGILPLPEYRYAVKNLRKHLAVYRSNRFLENPEYVPLLNLTPDERRYTPDFAGWMNYLADTDRMGFIPQLKEKQKPAVFPAVPRRFHSYIAAPNGWGKSELLKALAFHDIQHETGSLVVIDPLGDTAKQIARFPELAVGDRLVKLKPGLIPDHFPCINPLEKPGFTADEKAAYAETLGGTLALISGQALSEPMHTLTTACVMVLLDRPGSTLLDLAAMLLDPPKPAKNGEPEPQSPRTPLMREALNHPDEQLRSFFQYEFDDGIYKTTKAGLRTRLRRLLLLPSFRAMTCGPSTVDLEGLMEARKVVLFDLSPLGKQGRFAFGRLLLGQIEDIGFRRERLEREDRTPVQVIIDEASFMISPTLISMINNLRKFGIHLTLAQQVAGQNLDTDSRRVLLSVGVKIAGSDSRAELAQMFGEHARELGEVRRGEFWVKWGEAAPVRLAVRSDLADKTHAVTDEQWQATVNAQARFYRRRDAFAVAVEPADDVFQVPPGGRRQAGRERWPRMPDNALWKSLKVD